MKQYLLKASPTRKSPPIHAGTLSVTSRALNMPVPAIKKFLARLVEISTVEEYQLLLADKSTLKIKRTISEPNRNIIIFDDKSAIITADLNWETLNLLIVAVEGNNDGYNRILEFNTRYRRVMNQLYEIQKANTIKINEIFEELFSVFLFFNASQFMEEAKKAGFKCYIDSEKGGVICVLLDVTIEEMNYEIISVLIDDWQVKAFHFRFADFDFNSTWGHEIVLHPQLSLSSLPFGKDNILEFTIGDYTNFVAVLYKLILGSNIGIGEMSHLFQKYMNLKGLWTTLRDNEITRTQLSKNIFTFYEEVTKKD